MNRLTENKQTSTDGKDWTNAIRNSQNDIESKRSFSEKIETHQTDFDESQDYFTSTEEFTSYDFLKWIIFVLCIVQVVYQVSYIWHSVVKVMEIMSTSPSTRLVNVSKLCVEMQCSTKVLAALHMAAFVYPLSFFMHLCALTALTQHHGWDPVRLSQVNSGSRLFLALGAPIFGRFGDLYGSILALRIALLSVVASYFFAAVAHNLFFLYLSRVPLIFSHAYQGSQMVLTHITCKQHRANSLARLSFVFRSGLLLGPLLANKLLCFWQPRNVLMLSFVSSLLCYVIIYTYLPTTITKQNCDGKVFDISHILCLQFSCGVLLMTTIKVISAIPAIILQHIIYHLWINYYKIGPEDQQTLVFYTSLGDIILHGFVLVIVHFVRDDAHLLLLAIGQLFCSYMIIAAFSQFEVLIVSSVILSSGLVLLNLATRTILTKLVDVCDTGCVLGLYMMKDLLSSLLTPYLQSIGIIQVQSDPNWIGRIGVLGTGIVILIIAMCIKPK